MGIVLEDTTFTTSIVIVLALGDSCCRLSCMRLFASLISVLVIGRSVYQVVLLSLALDT